MIQRTSAEYRPLFPEKSLVKVGILSDTHGYVPDEALDFLSRCDVILHAGDIGSETVADALEKKALLLAVYGNIDGPEIRGRFPETQRVTLGGLRCFMTHIAGYPGRYQARIKAFLKEEQPDLVVCGHSHILKIIYDQELRHLHINPGACGLFGWHTRLTAVRFALENGKPAAMEVWEKVRPRHADMAQEL